MNDFMNTLISEFEKEANPSIAVKQKAYMRNQFDFLGLTAPMRKQIQKPFMLVNYLPKKNKLEAIIKNCWSRPEREYHHFAQEFALKYKSQFTKDDIELFEFMVTHNSWWDTVDFIAANLLGEYFKKYPETRKKYVEKWIASEHMWLQRCALLFQLKYKSEVDTELLSYAIRSLLGSKEFFINKAIGWALRQYSRVNPSWVIDFANSNTLANLSRKEALRLII